MRTPTLFKSLALASGINVYAAAAEVLKIPRDTAASYWLGRRNPPPEILRRLSTYSAAIQAETDAAIHIIETALQSNPTPAKIRLRANNTAVNTRILQILPPDLIILVDYIDMGPAVEIL